MKSFSCLLIVSFLLVASVSSNPFYVKLKEISPGRKVFVNFYNQQVFFHGVNAVVKGPPWIPETNFFNANTSLVDKDFQYLKRLGISIIRLGAMWPAIEPENGVFNETFLEQLKNLTRKAAEYGISTLLDMHQDVLSEKFCGEGAPHWAVFQDEGRQFPWPVGPSFTEFWNPVYKYPTRQECSQYPWGNLYAAEQTGIAFQKLYKDETFVGYWQRFWKKIAQTFVNETQVIGFDLINEPWAGDTVKDPLLYVPGVADRENLQPVYAKLSESIWEVDPDRLVFFSGVTWDDPVPAGFQHAPGGEQNSYRSVFSFHYYVPPQYNLGPYFKQRVNDANRLKTGVMLTEFGGYPLTNSSSRSLRNPHQYLERKLKQSQGTDNLQQPTFEEKANMCDKYLLSWAMWEYKSFCQQNYTTDEQANITQNDAFGACKTGYGGEDFWFFNGTQNIQSARHFARTYPYVVSGNTTYINFDYSSGNFTLKYQIDTNITERTIIYLNRELYYPNGYYLKIQPNLTYVISSPLNEIQLINENNPIYQGTEVTIHIYPPQNQSDKVEQTE